MAWLGTGPSASSSYTSHDGRSFAERRISDGARVLTLSLVKRSSRSAGPGGDWALRIACAGECAGTSLVLFATNQLGRFRNDAEEILVAPVGLPIRADGSDAALAGTSPGVGRWAVRLRADPELATSLRFFGADLPSLADAHALLGSALGVLPPGALPAGATRGLPNRGARQGLNFGAVQVTFSRATELDWVFLGYGWGPVGPNPGSGEFKSDLAWRTRGDSLVEEDLDTRAAALSGELLSSTIEGRRAAVTARAGNSREEIIDVLGRLSSFASVDIAVREGGEGRAEVEGSWRLPRLSVFTPLPRGEGWAAVPGDDGADMEHLAKWDAVLAADVLAHWLDHVTRAGWLPSISPEALVGGDAPPSRVGERGGRALALGLSSLVARVSELRSSMKAEDLVDRRKVRGEV